MLLNINRSLLKVLGLALSEAPWGLIPVGW